MSCVCGIADLSTLLFVSWSIICHLGNASGAVRGVGRDSHFRYSYDLVAMGLCPLEGDIRRY